MHQFQGMNDFQRKAGDEKFTRSCHWVCLCRAVVSIFLTEADSGEVNLYFLVIIWVGWSRFFLILCLFLCILFLFYLCFLQTHTAQKENQMKMRSFFLAFQPSLFCFLFLFCVVLNLLIYQPTQLYSLGLMTLISNSLSWIPVFACSWKQDYITHLWTLRLDKQQAIIQSSSGFSFFFAGVTVVTRLWHLLWAAISCSKGIMPSAISLDQSIISVNTSPGPYLVFCLFISLKDRLGRSNFI